MTMFTSYDDDGRVISSGRALNAEEQVPEVGGVFRGAQFDGDEFYFPGGAPMPRPDAPTITFSAAEVIADGEASITLDGVPVGAKVIMGGAELIADGTEIHLSTDLIGANRVIVDAFPAKRWQGTFNGVAAVNAPAP